MMHEAERPVHLEFSRSASSKDTAHTSCNARPNPTKPVKAKHEKRLHERNVRKLQEIEQATHEHKLKQHLEQKQAQPSFLKCVQQCIQSPAVPATDGDVTPPPHQPSMTDLTDKIFGFLPEPHEISRPTPDAYWFKPRTGWPRRDRSVKYRCGGARGDPPPSLMPAPLMPLLPPPEDELGILRVELLETDDLPALDGVFDENDVYAVLIFEGTMARTNTMPNVRSPAWSSDMARAFEFPIYSPMSDLHVALFDCDEYDAVNIVDKAVSGLVDKIQGLSTDVFDNMNQVTGGTDRTHSLSCSAIGDLHRQSMATAPLNEDDPVGRVVLQTRGLLPGVVYDAWFELRVSSARDDAGQFGALRLRYSVEWHSEARRMYAYLGAPPEFVLPIPRNLESIAKFTLHGSVDTAFDIKLLKQHGYELKDAIKDGMNSIISVVFALIFYTSPLVSLVACVLWQLMLLYPARVLPLIAPLSLLGLLRQTHHDAHRKSTDIDEFPTFGQLLLGTLRDLLLPSTLATWMRPRRRACAPPVPVDGTCWIVDTSITAERPVGHVAIESEPLGALLLKTLETALSDSFPPKTLETALSDSLPPTALRSSVCPPRRSSSLSSLHDVAASSAASPRGLHLPLGEQHAAFRCGCMLLKEVHPPTSTSLSSMHPPTSTSLSSMHPPTSLTNLFTPTSTSLRTSLTNLFNGGGGERALAVPIGDGDLVEISSISSSSRSCPRRDLVKMGDLVEIQLPMKQLRELGVRHLLRRNGCVSATRMSEWQGKLIPQTLHFVPTLGPQGAGSHRVARRAAGAPYPPLVRQDEILKQRLEAVQAEAKRQETEAKQRAEFESLVDPQTNAMAALAQSFASGAADFVGSAASGMGAVLHTAVDTLGTAGKEVLLDGNVIGGTSSLVTNVGKTAVTAVTGAAHGGLGVVREALRTSGRAVDSTAHFDLNTILEPIFGWIQASLAAKLVPLRAARGLLTWADPVLTTWLVLLLLALTAVLPLLPWLFLMRLTGLLLLGPHMVLVGQYLNIHEPPPADSFTNWARATDVHQRQQIVNIEKERRALEKHIEIAAETKRKSKLPFASVMQERRAAGQKLLRALTHHGSIVENLPMISTVEVEPSLICHRVLAMSPDKRRTWRSTSLQPPALYDEKVLM